ncbi:probable cytochrome P450 9f2 isoform X2 [Uranotaenia lowii]|uniref:probable cytochrome P450 9f2 isoform X2 n=1 Tax=Uranotaenia lowii TaxID=190385 RepID=UPI00247A6E8F|nr:probable cytochrome P450 9f2 isoform X2 [Uranotaenia lowii]
MDLSLITLALVAIVVGLIYRRLTRNNDYFHHKPIPSMAVRPLLGSTSDMIMQRVSFFDFIHSAYNKYAGVKVFGLFDMTTPLFVIRDPELIKTIAVKDFDHFTDRRRMFGDGSDENPDVYFNKMIIALTGQQWKDMRATLSPAFTGSKMRLMMGLMTDYCGQVIPILKRQAISSQGYLDREMKDLFTRMGNDIIATCAYGLQVESIENSENDFYLMGKNLTNFNRVGVIARLICSRTFPRLLTLFGIDLFDKSHTKYFADIIREAVRTRSAQGIVRPDMIHLLMQAGKGTLKHGAETAGEPEAGFATAQESEIGRRTITMALTESEIVAQCLSFFIGGFDSISTMMVFMTYELALHPEVQQRLYKEIHETHVNLKEDFNHCSHSSSAFRKHFSQVSKLFSIWLNVRFGICPPHSPTPKNSFEFPGNGRFCSQHVDSTKTITNANKTLLMLGSNDFFLN